MSPHFLQVSDLDFYYGSKPVIKGFNLTVPQGAHVWLKGPNGCGKTTLIALLYHLKSPTRGRIAFQGALEGLSKPEVRRKISYLGHQSFLNPYLSIAENLNFFASILGLSKWPTRVEGLLEAFGLSAKLSRWVGVLSQGELQKTKLLHALLKPAELILWDEPESALDLAAKETLNIFLVEELPHLTAIIASHEEWVAPQWWTHEVSMGGNA